MKSNADLLTEIGWLMKRTVELDRILKKLVDLKIYRDQYGADEKYTREKALVMDEAMKLLNTKGEGYEHGRVPRMHVSE